MAGGNVADLKVSNAAATTGKNIASAFANWHINDLWVGLGGIASPGLNKIA